MSKDKYEMRSVKLTEKAVSPDEASSIEKQTRTRRVFSGAQLFAFSLMYFVSWGYVPANMYFSLFNGGPAAWFWSFIVVFIGVVALAASLAELASVQPVAGAQYYWTYAYAPPSMKRVLTWMQGWITWAGYIANLASAFNGNGLIMESLISLNYPEFTTGGWHTTVIFLANLAFCLLINVFAFRIVPWFEFLSGILNICLFLIFAVVLLVMSPRNSADIFMETNVSSGWDSYFTAANIGALSNVFLFIGFEAVVHMGEETIDAKRAVPRALFWSIFVDGILALVMIIIVLFSMPDVETLLNSSSPLVTLMQYATRSDKGATALISGFIVMGISCNMTFLSSVSRLTWAWARDGGLPKYFAHVDEKHRVPIRAVVLSSVLASLLSLLNIGGGSYIALGAITSLASLGAYCSYTIILLCILYARWAGRFEAGPWTLGRLGPYLNVFSLVFTVWAMIFLPFPAVLPVTASNMNYAGPVFGAVLVGAISLWFVYSKKHWSGPNLAIMNAVLLEE